MEVNKKTPKVSVCVVTYNHEKYIRQCLQSIVDQETDFDFEVVVADDCSTDNTQKILQEFAERYPRIIRIILHQENIGASKNFAYAHQQALGEYIAHIDGDDYALPSKLKKQVEFLDSNPQISFVVHKVKVVSALNEALIRINPSQDQPIFTSVEKLIENYLFFTHSSKMYRRSFRQQVYGYAIDVIDFYYHVEDAKQGPIGFINEILGVYRQNVSGSLTTTKGKQLYNLFTMTLDVYDRAIELGINEVHVFRGKNQYLFGAALHCISLNDQESAIRYLSQCDSKWFKKISAAKFICLLVDIRAYTLIVIILKFIVSLRKNANKYRNLYNRIQFTSFMDERC